MIKYSLKIKLRKDRKNKEGLCPIVLQCFINGEKTVINTGDFIPLQSWDEKNSQAKPSKKLSQQEADEINLSIGHLEQTIKRVFHDHRRSGKVLTIDQLKRILDNPMARFDFHLWAEDQIKNLEGARAQSTIKHYKVTFRALREFRPELKIADLSPTLVDEFEIFLQKRKLTPNSRAKYHKHLKMFSRMLMRSGSVGDIYRFFQIKQRQGDRVFLNRHEVATLESMYKNQVLHPVLHSKLARFLFSCYTGIRGEGLNKIDWKNFADGFVKYDPSKLEYISKRVKVPISEKAMEFIEFTEGRMFSQISLDKYNQGLQEIAKLAGITKHITSHVGRHTFATGFLMEGGNHRLLQEYLGHAKLETTMVYVHMTDEREKEERHVLEGLFKKK